MKKFLSAAIPLLILSLIVTFLYSTVKNRAEKIIEKEIAKAPGASVHFDSLKVGFLVGFPNLSVAVGDLTVTSREKPDDEPLLKAELLYFSVNAASLLWGNRYEITEAGLQNARFAFVKNAEGYFNWDIFKKPDARKMPSVEAPVPQTNSRVKNEKTVGIFLKKLSLRNVEVLYSDGDFYADIRELNADAFGSSSTGQLTAGLGVSSGIASYGKINGGGIDGIKLSSALKVTSEPGGTVFKIENGLLKLNDITTDFSGKIAAAANGADVDITAEIKDASLNGITALLPPSVIKPVVDMKADGNVSVKIAAEGPWSKNSIPEAKAEINVGNISFEKPVFMKSVKNMKAFLSLSPPDDKMSNRDLAVDSIELSADDGIIKAEGVIKNIFKAPELDIKISGEVPAESIGNLYRYEYVTVASGSAVINAAVQGSASNVAAESNGGIKVTGTAELKNVAVLVKGYSDITVPKALVEFYPEYALIRDAAISSSNGSALINGKIIGYSQYIFEGQAPHIEAEISSDFIDLNEIVKKNPQIDERTSDSENGLAAVRPQNPDEQPTEPVNTAKASERRVPDATVPERRIIADADLKIKIKKLIFKNAVLNNLSCSVIIKNGEAEILNLSFDAMGGSIDLSGLYSFNTGGKKASVETKIKAENLGFHETFAYFKSARELVPVFNSVDGSFSLNGGFRSKPGANRPFSVESVEGSGTLTIKEARTAGIKTLEKIGSLLKIENPGRLSLKNVVVSFDIKDGELTTKPFDVKIGGAVGRFYGTTSLNRTLDYYGKIIVPSPWGDKKNPVSTDFRVTGSYDSPELTVSSSDILNRAVDSLLKGIFR